MNVQNVLPRDAIPSIDDPTFGSTYFGDPDDEVIVDAYRERVKDAHPDQGGSIAEFQAVKTAYERLQNGYEPGDPLPDEDAESEAEPAPPEPDDPLVEFLNFEVLDDRGWALDDDDLFEKAAAADLDTADYGRFYVEPNDTLLEAAERNEFAWPFACRGGACANCAVVVLEGELTTRVDHVLPDEMVERGFQLSCNGIPISDELKLLYNVKTMPELEDLLLPPRPFEQAHSDD